MWQRIGYPTPFNLVEMGPGRGTLMRDLYRAGGALPAFLDAAEIYLVEVSPTLVEQQTNTLSDLAVDCSWINEIAALPDRPTLLVANELLDALPFRQWVKTNQHWLERAIGLGDDGLVFTTRPSILDPQFLPENEAKMPPGTIFETSPAREALIGDLANGLTDTGGAALFIDYGHTISDFGDTFQAVKDHAFVAPLDEPGSADLTSHVDFAALSRVAQDAGCVVAGPVSQAGFLLSMGLLERAGALGTDQTPQTQETLTQAVERLAGADQMGELFKVMAFGTPSPTNNSWPGFK